MIENPNSSFVWIKFLAFFLSKGEENAARAVLHVRFFNLILFNLIFYLLFFYFILFFI